MTTVIGKGVSFQLDKPARYGCVCHFGVILFTYVAPNGERAFMVRTVIMRNVTNVPIFHDEITGIEE